MTRFREAFAALAAGDIEPCLAHMRDDFLNVNDIGAGPWRENRGRKATMRFWGEWMELFDNTFRQEILDGIGYDDRVVLIIHETGTAQGRPSTTGRSTCWSWTRLGSGRPCGPSTWITTRSTGSGPRSPFPRASDADPAAEGAAGAAPSTVSKPSTCPVDTHDSRPTAALARPGYERARCSDRA